jgi:hypothetical protein
MLPTSPYLPFDFQFLLDYDPPSLPPYPLIYSLLEATFRADWTRLFMNPSQSQR